MPPSPPPEDSELDRLLDRWGHATPPPPDGLKAEVWRRLAPPQRPGGLARWLERIHAAFAQPAFAAMFVAACVLLGLFLAEVRRSRLQAEYGTLLAQNYVRLIDPLFGEAPHPPAATP